MTDLNDIGVKFKLGDVVLAPKSRFPTTEFIVGMHHVHEFYSGEDQHVKECKHYYMIFRRDVFEDDRADLTLQVRGLSLEIVEEATEETISIAKRYIECFIEDYDEDESDEYYVDPNSLFGRLVKTTKGNFLVVKENEDENLESEGIKECVVINIDTHDATFLRLPIGDDTDPDKYHSFKNAQIQETIHKSKTYEGEHGSKLNYNFLIEQGVIVE